MDKSSWGRGLPFGDWPTQDRAMWEGLTRSGDAFDERGPLSHLRPISLAGYRLSYGQWLQHLADEGIDLSVEAPDVRVTLPRLRRYHEAISHLSPRSMATRFVQLRRVLSKAFPNAAAT